jgi:GTP pyrophosphokinase
MQTQSDVDSHTATIALTVEISNIEQLSQLLAKIRQLSNVMDVHRRRDR